MPHQVLPLIYKMLGHSAGLIGGLGIFTAIDFTHQVTLGSVILTIVIVLIAGLFTVRSKIATIWREEAEGERAAKERLQEELAAERVERAEFEKQQQEVRHELKNELAAVRSQLKVMEARTDLTAALDAIKEMNEHTAGVIAEAMQRGSAQSQQRDEQTHHLLEEIRDKLPSEPIEVRPAVDEPTN